MNNKDNQKPAEAGANVEKAFPVEHVAGTHKLSDECVWEELGPSSAQTFAIQRKFDELIELDAKFKEIVQALKRHGLKAVVIGGWVRDQFINGTDPPFSSGDIDLVVDGKSGSELEILLPSADKRTVFGGFTFCGAELDVDVWSLQETYLLRRYALSFTFSNVLAVTDFNINAILFYPKQFWGTSKLQDGGCLSSVQSREIHFHFEWVPIPVVQVSRLVHFSTKTGFSLSEEARKFIRRTCLDGSLREQVLQNLEIFCPQEFRKGAKELIDSIGAVETTRYFSNCLGVFEGGGVRASAFAGAYSAACEAGINFTRIAGTSGGAIAAAFIATGAQSSAVKRQLFEADLGTLAKRLDSSQILGGGKRLLMRLLRRVSRGRLNEALTLDLFAGFYTSEDLGTWIEHALHELLSSRGSDLGTRAVTFADLPIPLYVVASDLTRNRPHVWSREATPEASVAFAVRCSCNIPFFFQPIRGEGDIAFVDGGMLSNAPAFVFRDEQVNDSTRYSARILEFRLIQPNRRRTAVLGSFKNFFSAVGDTVIDGGSHLQRDLQSGIYAVDIDTRDIGSTDFQKVKGAQKSLLFDQGRKAVETFVRNERDKLHTANVPTTFVGRDQKMLLFVDVLKRCVQEIVFVDESCIWLYLIFPAVLAAARRGISIRYVTSAGSAPNGDEIYCQELLLGLGVSITRVPEIPFRGFLSDPTLPSAGRAAVTRSRSGSDAFDYESTRTYSAHSDEYVVKTLYAKLAPHLAGSEISREAVGLAYQVCADAKLFDRLRCVPQYKDATFTIGEVAIDDSLFGMQMHIKEFKYLQIDWLIQDFIARHIELFQPQEVLLAGGLRTIVTPPVVEISGDKHVLMEGHTRAFHCLRQGRKSFVAVIVDKVDAALPAQMQRFNNIAFASRTVNRQAQYGDYDPALWRTIEPHVHPINGR